MPIALLLQASLAPLGRAERVLDAWRSVLDLGALIIDRARGAFLMHWFGVGLPRQDGQVLVVIANTEELARQYQQARARSIGGQTGPNLLEPVAGLAGTVVGMAISPTAAILYLYAALRTSLGWFPSVLLTITHALPMTELITGLGGAAAVILFPIALLSAFGLGIAAAAGVDALPMAYEVVGLVAQAIRAITRFVNLLLGPRSAIRNPLLRGALEIFDRLAALVAQIVGAIAVVVTRIGPLIYPNALQARALMDLAQATGALVRVIVQEAADILLGLFRSGEGAEASPWEVAQRLIAGFVAGLHRLLDQIGEAIRALGGAISRGAQQTMDAAESGIRNMFDAVRGIIADFPLIRSFRAAAMVATTVRTIVAGGRTSSTTTPSPPSSGPSMLGLAASFVLPPPRPAPRLPGLPDVAQIENVLGPPPPAPSLGSVRRMLEERHVFGLLAPSAGGAFGGAMPLAAPFALDAETRRRAALLATPPASVFAGERARTAEELGGRTPAEAFEALREEDLHYRDLLAAVVGRVLPLAVRAYMPDLLNTFEAIDRYIYGRAERTEQRPEDFPLRDLPDNGRLRPVVHRLTIRTPGGDEISLRGFATDLASLLRRQPYLVPAG